VAELLLFLRHQRASALGDGAHAASPPPAMDAAVPDPADVTYGVEPGGLESAGAARSGAAGDSARAGQDALNAGGQRGEPGGGGPEGGPDDGLDDVVETVKQETRTAMQ
jgi:hypothetical protein